MNGLIKWRPERFVLPWRPFSGMWSRDFFDDFFEEMQEIIGPAEGETMRENRWAPRVESYQKNGSYVIKADLPGVNVKDIHVSVEGDRLIIKGERKLEKEVTKGNLRKREIFYGSFQRGIRVPKGLNTDSIKAKYHDGVLEIIAPVEKAQLSKEVKVEVEKAA